MQSNEWEAGCAVICAHGTGVGCLACAGELVTLRAELATVRAERDRMRPVVDAALRSHETGKRIDDLGDGDSIQAHYNALADARAAVDDYLASEPTKGTK